MMGATRAIGSTATTRCRPLPSQHDFADAERSRPPSLHSDDQTTSSISTWLALDHASHSSRRRPAAPALHHEPFVFTPSGTPHVAGCSEPCAFYEASDGKPDFVLLQAPKSP